MKITIIGGGTAGWLAALYITSKQPSHEVTVIDSSKLGIIGVGEGTTGKFMDIIQNHEHNFGINEADFIRETGATAKMGIRFTNWQGRGETWISPIDNTPSISSDYDYCLIDWILKNGREKFHLSTICGQLAEHNLSTIDRSGQVTYSMGAYHFDGHQVGKYFKRIASPRCRAVLDTEIEGWQLDSRGNIRSVRLANGTEHYSDYWVDCSGFARVLAPAVHPGWHSYRDRLTCDSALLFQTRHDAKTEAVEPLTLAEAMDAGWRFRIPTQERYGNGYVFDSSTTTEDQALAELQARDPSIEPRKTIKFEPGRLEQSFCKNVAFIGLSAVFLEPLQATSIHGTIAQLEHLMFNIVKPTGLAGPREQAAVNATVNRTFDQFSELIQLHYQSGRRDTAFWRKQQDEVRVSDQVLLLRELCQHRWPTPGDFFLNRSVAGYSVFIYPILAYNWIDLDAVRQDHRVARDWSRYYNIRRSIAQHTMTHSEFILRARSGAISNLARREPPTTAAPSPRIHPLLR